MRAHLRLRLRVTAAVAILSLAASARGQLRDYEAPAGEGEQPGPVARMAAGGAVLQLDDHGGTERRQDGLALGFRAAQRGAGRLGTAVTLTWGLTDWDRAGEWIDAGNDAGSWTTEKIAQVAHWSQEGGDAQPLRFMGAIFAEMFLVMTYVAVPVCYVGSIGGLTSHLQVDFTGTAQLVEGPIGLWVEGGLGAAGIPHHFLRWDYALGPVAGVGVDAGPVRVGGRLLWSPGGLNSSDEADRQLFAGSLMIGMRY